jgi:cobalt-zinc-cadmium efflux system outer membrane protein
LFNIIRCRASRRLARRTSRAITSSIIAAAACVVASRAQAQDASARAGGGVLLGTMLDAAAHANPRIAAANALSRASAARVPGASRLPDPELQVGWMNYEVPKIAPMNAVGMTQFQLMQTVPLRGKLRLAGRAESLRSVAVATRVQDIALDVRTQTATAFYDLYATDGAVAVARETRRILQGLAEIASSMYEVGEGRQADVLRAHVELARMDEEIIRMETMGSAMRSRLNAILARPDSTSIGSPQLPVFPAAIAALDSLTQLAEEYRPMIRAGVQDVDAADVAVDLARREIWPDLRIGVQYGRQPGSSGTQQMASLMFGVTLPLFASSRQFRMRDEAAAMREMAAAELAAMRAETRGATAEAYAELMRARRLVELYRSSVLPQAAATVTSSLAAYRVGSVNFMTLLDAQMTLNEYRQELFTLEAGEGKAWAELEMLTGQTLLNPHTAQPMRPGGGTRR